jgi:hypothetical protein
VINTIDVDVLKALAEQWVELAPQLNRDSSEGDYGLNAAYNRCAAELDKVIAQATPAAVTDAPTQSGHGKHRWEKLGRLERACVACGVHRTPANAHDACEGKNDPTITSFDAGPMT